MQRRRCKESQENEQRKQTEPKGAAHLNYLRNMSK
jgi:hypothetical protein